MKKRKNRPKNSFRIRRFKGKQIHLSYVQGKHQQGIMMGQGAQFIHLVNEDSLRPSLFVFKSAISMIELEDVLPIAPPRKKMTRRESSMKANEQQKQQEELKRVMRRKKGINYE